jgi:hypothetical protein
MGEKNDVAPRIAGPLVPAQEDFHYPSEQAIERQQNPAPAVLAIELSGAEECTVTLRNSSGGTATTVAVPGSFGSWEVLTCVSEISKPKVFLQHTFRRWSLIVAAAPHTAPTLLRSSVGSAADILMPRYNLTATEPSYFTRAVHERADYIGRRMLADTNGEPTIIGAMRYEAPAQEYALFGTNAAPIKWVTSPDGVIKRSDRALLELGNNDTAAGCAFTQVVQGYYLAGYLNVSIFRFGTLEAAQAACCSSAATCGGITKEREPSTGAAYTLRAGKSLKVGKPTDEAWLCLSCASEGSVIFDPWKVAGFRPGAASSEYKSGLVGGFLRVVAVGVFDRALGKGIEMLTFGPSLNASHQVLVRLRVVDASTAAAPASHRYRYFRACLDSSSEMEPVAGARLFYGELMRYAANVEQFFSGTAITLPEEDQRQLDMSYGAILLGITDWVGNKQNYGAGAVYWGPGGSLSLTTLALLNPMLWFGLVTPALDALGYYLDRFVSVDGQLPGKCRALPANMTVGNFDDGYADYGRIIDLYVRAVQPGLVLSQ